MNQPLKWHGEWPGYGADDKGTIWSTHGRMPKPLKPWRKKCGHLCASLRREGRTYRILVHRFVLELFVGPCPPQMEARHKNGIPTDNRLDNLEWNTRSVNTVDRYYHSQPSGRAKLRPDQAAEIKQRRLAGESAASLALTFGVTETTVSHIATGKTWMRLSRLGERVQE